MGIPNVKQKLTITGGGAPSISGIQDALGTLRQLGAPAEGGKLTLQQNINGWAIFIEWTPEPVKEEAKPEDNPERWHNLPGVVIPDPEIIARRIRSDFDRG